jgi:hypothetical protein
LPFGIEPLLDPLLELEEVVVPEVEVDVAPELDVVVEPLLEAPPVAPAPLEVAWVLEPPPPLVVLAPAPCVALPFDPHAVAASRTHARPAMSFTSRKFVGR